MHQADVAVRPVPIASPHHYVNQARRAAQTFGVSTLAGYVPGRDGAVLTFTLMSSGTPVDVARPAMDAVTAALRGCGCR